MALIRLLRKFKPSDGPHEVTEDMAKEFKGWRAIHAKPYTLRTNLKGLSAIWKRWLIEETGLCQTNPWLAARPPKKMDLKRPRVLTDDEINIFLDWFDNRYDGWKLPSLFIRTLLATGARLREIAGLTRDRLKDGRILFLA